MCLGLQLAQYTNTFMSNNLCVVTSLKRSYPLHKAPTFAGFGRGHGKQPYPQFIGKADSQTRTHNLSLKALAIAPRHNAKS